MRIARFCRRVMCDPALERFLRELSNRIKFLDKNWFFAFWSLLQYMYQNRSFSCFQDVQMDDCQKYKWFRGPSKSIDKNHKFWFLNYKYDEVSSQKILSVYDNFKCSVREIRGGGGCGEPPPTHFREMPNTCGFSLRDYSFSAKFSEF